MILRPVRPQSALRTADHETAGGVDEVVDLLAHQFRWQHRLDDLLDHRLAQILVADLRMVLRRQHHGVDLGGLAIYILDGDL